MGSRRPKMSPVMQRNLRVERTYPKLKMHIVRLFRTPKSSPMYEESHRRASTLAVLLMTGCRPGRNGNATKDGRTYGLTTLQASHIQTSGGACTTLQYGGKKNVSQKHKVCDKQVSAWVRYAVRNKKRLFLSDAQLRSDPILASTGVRPKDIRTWKANQIASQYRGSSKKEVLQKVSEALGNTPSVCEKYYVAPEILSKGPRAQVK